MVHKQIHIIHVFLVVILVGFTGFSQSGCTIGWMEKTSHEFESFAGQVELISILPGQSCNEANLYVESTVDWLTVAITNAGKVIRIECTKENKTLGKRQTQVLIKVQGAFIPAGAITVSQKKSCYKAWYPDNDLDGFGDALAEPVISCSSPFENGVNNNEDECPDIQSLTNKGCPAGIVLEDRNWIRSETYDINGKVISKSKAYFDALGKSEQTQTVDLKTEKTWASHTLYDSQGRPALQTLSAPTNGDITNDFTYRNNFIQDDSDSSFDTLDYEGTNLENPSPVGTQPNSLGWYYSDNNTDEPYQDITDRPYSRTIYSELNPGTILKTIGGNKMEGEWKNAYVFSMPAGQELSKLGAFGDTKYDNYKVLKTVSRDVHGVESVVFTDTDGRTLAAARSGNEDGAASNGASRVYIKEQGYVDIHIPVGITGFQISGSNGIELVCYDLITEALITTPEDQVPSGLYRVAVKDINSYTYDSQHPITITYTENYYDYSLNEYDKAGRLLSSKQPLEKQESTFEYNALGQLTQTHSPDEGDAWFLYRKDGQIRFSINSKQWKNKQFSYTNYDSLGRPVESGVYKDNASTYLIAYAENVTAATDPFKNTLKNLIDRADGDGLNDANCSEIHITTYDYLSTEDTNFLGGLATEYRTPGFLSGNVAKTLNIDHNNNRVSTTYYSYDIYGRVQWLVQDIAGLGVKTINYVYDPVTSQVDMVIYQKNSISDRFIHKYTYDPDDYSLMKVETATNVNGPFTEQAAYSYYETGGLKQLNLAEGLQKIDYVYNLNGALKSINHPSLSAAQDPGGNADDIFGMTLHYYQNDYARTSRSNITTTANGINQYNGNIKATTWNTRETNTTAGNPDTYYYDYNKNNWLEGASLNHNINNGDPNLEAHIIRNSYVQPQELAKNSVTLNPGFHVLASNGTSFSAKIDQGTPVATNKPYNVYGITYDANGNIQRLNRNRDTYNGSTEMDQLEYAYDTEKPNQLKQVIDGARENTNADDIKTQQANNYIYNSIGQLIENKEEKITYLYNASGLVTEVAYNGTPVVKFFYNDRGHRIRKQSFINNYTEYYVRDAAGSVMAIYRNGTVSEYPIYGSGRIGVHKKNGATLYQLTDHLGNVRAVVSRSQQSQAIKTPSGKTDYYPGGMAMPNRNLQGGYRYGYQGEFAETDPETGKPAFELRLYDPRINRWLTPDPYGQFHSPYLAMDNRPNMLVDPDGGCTVGVDCPKDFDWMEPGTTVLDEVVIGGGNGINWETDSANNGGLFNFGLHSQSFWRDLYSDQSWRNKIWKFDGSHLSTRYSDEIYDTSIFIPTTSGADPYINDPSAQNIQNKGPIPEGVYLFRNADWNHQSTLRQAYNIIRGNGDWGDYNVPLTPLSYDGKRHSFYIHGGYFKGSAGCLDCGSHSGTVYEESRNQRNSILIVNYGTK